MPRRSQTASSTVQDAENFYREALLHLAALNVPHLVGGAYAMRAYSGIVRDTKDLDIFCKAGDYQTILASLAKQGFDTSITDANWLAKAKQDGHYIDLIFNSANNVFPVDDTWFQHAVDGEIVGVPVRLVPAEEMLCTKAMVQDRNRFDGADVMHIIRQSGSKLDWRRILARMELEWELLFAQLLTFRFVYPSDRDSVPHWLLKELLTRVEQQLELPTPEDPICRGVLLSRTEYEVDITLLGYRWASKPA